MGEDPTRTLDFDPDSRTSPGAPYIEIVDGPVARRRILVPPDGVVLGRGEKADVQLEADGVSRKHARVINNGEGLINVLDLGSTNGTFLNGRRIDVAVLRAGDEVRVGQVVLLFGFAGQDEVAPAPQGPSLRELLTPRELEVATLVAEGLTNPEIGKRLFISPRTVATHLANIYERLDIHSRAALASRISELK